MARRAEPSLKAARARALAADWVGRHAPAHRGAYVGGSVAWLADDDAVPATSDVDIMLVAPDGPAPPRPGKFRHEGLLLEASYVTLSSPAQVLGDYHLAGPLHTDTILSDPTGALRPLQRAVAAGFAEPRWVRTRSRHAYQRVETGLTDLDLAAPWPELVLAWLFPTAVAAHIVLVAAMGNPTIRLRYLRARAVLQATGRLDVYEDLLQQLGCAQWTAAQTARHLEALAPTFDAAAAVARTPFAFRSDITLSARAIAIDGGAELISRGDHREAVFWIIATFARCLQVLTADGDPQPHRAAFEASLADLGLTSAAAVRDRAATTLAYLPALWHATVERLVPPDRADRPERAD